MVAAHKQCRGAKRTGVALRPSSEVVDSRAKPRKAACQGKKAEKCPTQFLMEQTQHRQSDLAERAKKLLEMEIDYIAHESFAEADAEAQCTDIPEAAAAKKRVKAPSGATGYLAALYEVPLLEPAQEAALFRKMNYLKHQADLLRRQIDPKKPCASLIREAEELLDQARLTRDQIVRANLRLVVSIAKQYLDSDLSFDDLVSDGNVALMRAVEKFDFSRGFRFSTYATWAIKRLFYRSLGTQRQRQTRFVSGDENLFDLTPDETLPVEGEMQDLRELSSNMHGIVDRLDDRERAIIAARFGLGTDEESTTLAELGRQLGVSKERVRQIEARALRKLRGWAEEAHISPPELD
jgi:RNA polymerase sigma factor (sigma-70 family)